MMRHINHRFILITLFSIGVSLLVTSASALGNTWYAGILGGYGSTNWSRISTENDSLQATMPSGAKDDGFTWGLIVGDNINTYFGAELRYQRFANSRVSFAQFNEYDPDSNFAPFDMNSRTEAYMFLGKLRIPVNQRLELYSIFGASITYRKDQLNSLHGLGGVFGGGADFAVTQHWHNGLEFDFVTGNAPINLAPAQYYQPFLVSLVDKIEYFF